MKLKVQTEIAGSTYYYKSHAAVSTLEWVGMECMGMFSFPSVHISRIKSTSCWVIQSF